MRRRHRRLVAVLGHVAQQNPAKHRKDDAEREPPHGTVVHTGLADRIRVAKGGVGHHDWNQQLSKGHTKVADTRIQPESKTLLRLWEEEGERVQRGRAQGRFARRSAAGVRGVPGLG